MKTEISKIYYVLVREPDGVFFYWQQNNTGEVSIYDPDTERFDLLSKDLVFIDQPDDKFKDQIALIEQPDKNILVAYVSEQSKLVSTAQLLLILPLDPEALKTLANQEPD